MREGEKRFISQQKDGEAARRPRSRSTALTVYLHYLPSMQGALAAMAITRGREEKPRGGGDADKEPR